MKFIQRSNQLIQQLQHEITRLEQVQSLNLEKEWEKLRSYRGKISEVKKY